MPGSEKVAHWIAEKLGKDGDFKSIVPLGSGFLELEHQHGPKFTAAAIGVDSVVNRTDVAPLFSDGPTTPEFVVNVPTRAIWDGAAISLIHDAPAAFGGLGELVRASRDDYVAGYRNKNLSFFEQGLIQHSAVRSVTRLYDKKFLLTRSRGMPDLQVVLVDAYDMSAEDVRNARDTYGKFDAALKMTSYGSITTPAQEAAKSMGAEAFKFGELMKRLNRR